MTNSDVLEVKDREQGFSNALKQLVPEPHHLAPCYGTSNIGRLIPGGLVLGVANLVNYDANSGPLCIASRISVSPNAELYLCGVIRDVNKVADRLEEMLQTGEAGQYTQKNNNVSVCLAPGDSVYLYSKKVSELSESIPSHLGAPTALDKLYYSCFMKTDSEEDRDALRNLVRSLTRLVDSEKLNELAVWGTFAFPLPRSGAVAPASSLEGLVAQFVDSAQKAHLSVSSPFAARVAAALLAKRFLIFTGLSGSGKTKVADAFANWLCEEPDTQIRLVPVGADWTSNENLLGYPDALRPDNYCRPSTGILDLVLTALSSPELPFFLILDEMNLSHVERYFADVLSSMETGKHIGLHGNASLLNGVPKAIGIPDNLFIIGTVNIDETTYLFSPKVLDRANVIEFRASRELMDGFLESPRKVTLGHMAGQGAEFGTVFVDSARNETPPVASIVLREGGDAQEILRLKLLDIFDRLAIIGAEFGFRTAHEISRFVYFHHVLSGDDWTLACALDCQILQKLLPKLHGSERRLRPILDSLTEFCAENELPLSLEKLNRMSERLKDGFTSFAEA